MKAKGIGIISVLILMTLVVIPVMARLLPRPPIRNPAPVSSPGVGTAELFVIAFIILILILIIRKLLSFKR